MSFWIFQGGPENLRHWLKNPKYTDPTFGKKYEQWFWTASKQAKVGEVAFIYLTAPESRIVGTVNITGKPFYNDGQSGMFLNQHMQNKYCVEVGNPLYFGDQQVLTLKNLKKLFGVDWGWVRYPRGHTRIPDEIMPAFLELISPFLPEIQVVVSWRKP